MLRFDDQFPLHRKVSGLSDGAFRLHVEAIFWCARNLTDGFIPAEDLDVVANRARHPESLATQLVKRGNWHRVVDGLVQAAKESAEAGCAECAQRYEQALGEANPAVSEDGWFIHGFIDWQQPRSKVLAMREARAKAGSLGGKRSGESRKSSSAKTSKQSRSKPEASWLDVASPPIPPPPTEGGRASPRRADARGAAAAPPNDHTSPKCHECGNRTNTAYHRNNCAKGTP